MRRLFAFTAFVLIGAGAGAARAPEFPRSFVVADTKFARSGVAPIKARIIFTVCHAALYLPADARKADLLSGKIPKALEFFYHHKITGEEFAESAQGPLEENLTRAELSSIRADVARINRMYRDVKPGDRYRLVYVPGYGTELFLNGVSLGKISNPEFPGLYFRIWLGKEPIDTNTRDALLSEEAGTMAENGGNAAIYGFSAVRNDGETVSLGNYRGKVLLIVNTASKCGFTPQYEGLQALHETYGSKGLAVLGFPCNQFGKQDPGTNEEIQTFCTINYGVTFPIFEKVDVNGDGAHPLFTFLREEAPGVLGSTRIKWNFTKFLVSRDGQRITRYGSSKKPADLAADIEKLLAE